jgi:PIN domain nuclease of toxin-antitoxin system
VNLLLDTQLLLWTAGGSQRLPRDAVRLIDDPANHLAFSAASLWEIVIKNRLGRKDFVVDAAILRRGLLENGFEELPVTGAHALALDMLAPVHRDPFDRILIAQSIVEGASLVTADKTVARYGAPVLAV